MLTTGERRRVISGGAASLAGILLFTGLAVAALLAFDAGASAPSSLFDPYMLGVMRFTLLQATLSTLLSVGLAIPVARALARQRVFFGRIWIIRLMAVPMGLPVLIGALGLISIWGRQGLLNRALTGLGLPEPLSIYGLGGILLAHVFFNLPLACRLLLAGLERIPAEYWLISGGLGMKPASVFRFVEWPVIRRLLPGIAGLVFMLCATSFTLVLMLGGGPAATTLEVAIYQSLRFDFDPPRAITLALLQIAVTAVILSAMALFPAPEDRDPTAGKRVRRLDADAVSARLSDGLWVIAATVLLGAPLAAIVVSGLRADLVKLIMQPAFLHAATTSMVIALCAGGLSVLIAVTVIRAQAAIREQRRPGLSGRTFAVALSASSSLVLLVPPVVIATGWFLLLMPTGDVARFAPGLVVGLNALMALPFVTRVLAPAFETHRARTARLSASLGISGLSRLRLVDWPDLRRPLLTALSFAMALSLGDLGAVALFGSENLMTLPWLLYSRMGSYRTSDAEGLALILGLVCLALTIAGSAGQVPKEEKAGDR